MGAEQKSLATNFSISLGLARVQVDLAPIRKPKTKTATALQSFCPECQASMSGCQRFICPTGHGPFLPGELAKGRSEVGVLSMGELEELADDMPTGILELHVCPREELHRLTRYADNAYRLRVPSSHGTKRLTQTTREMLASTYSIFQAMAEHPTLALYGMAKINGNISTAAYELTVQGDQMILASLITPQDLAEPDEMPVGHPDHKLVGMATQLLEALAEPLDQEVFLNVRRAKLNALLASKEGAESVQVEAAKEPVAADSLLGALEAALRGARARKVA